MRRIRGKLYPRVPFRHPSVRLVRTIKRMVERHLSIYDINRVAFYELCSEDTS